ncbi:NUDIX hydrolase 8 [Tanacetum coccineum]|uniref:NUDIX hydrolase 8 n=1 Tax=Tanacetum coccineum TaxID=301880 RepID=A0ABQ5BSJ9_9ASTR
MGLNDLYIFRLLFYVHQSEEIFTGAVREVKEETRIETKFLEVIAFSSVSSEIKIDDLEVQAAKWMPLVELSNNR